MNYQPSAERINWGFGILAVIIASLSVYIITKPIGYLFTISYAEYFLHITPTIDIKTFFTYAFYSSFDFLPLQYVPMEVSQSSKWWNDFTTINSGKLYNIYIYTSYILAAITAVTVAKMSFKKQKNEFVIAGLESIKNTKEAHKYALKILNKACKKTAQGVCIHPGLKGNYSDALFLPVPSETRHFFICGSSGCGKTQILQHMMQSSCADSGVHSPSAYSKIKYLFTGNEIESTCRESDALNIIFDFKSDFTASMKAWMPEGMEPILFAPWDTRSEQWSMHKDMKRFTDPEKLATSLIVSKNQGDPYWTLAARDIMSAVLTALNDQMPGGWGPKELAAVFMSEPLLMQAIADYRPGAGKHISGEGGQTQGVQGALREVSQNLDSLARLWSDKDGISLVDLIKNPKKRKSNTIIISGNLDMPWFYPVCATMLSVIMSTVLTLPDSKKRKVFIYLDELGRLPRIEFLEPFMTAARSKGGRAILGIQDYGKLTEQYGKELSDTIISQCSTKILGKMNGGDTQEFAEKAFGKQVVERLSATSQAGQQSQGAGGDIDSAFGGGGSQSTSWQRDERSVVIGGEFAGLPSSEAMGGPTLFAKIDGVDKILKLWWPYQALPIVDENIIEKDELYTLYDAESSAMTLLEGDDNWLPAGSDSRANRQETEIDIENPKHQEVYEETEEHIEIQGPALSSAEDLIAALEEARDETPGDEMLGEVIEEAVDMTGGLNHLADGLDLLEDAIGSNSNSKSSGQHINDKKRKSKHRSLVA